jgi:hypothetical protein
MVQAIFCAAVNENQINTAIATIRAEGVEPSALKLISRPQELDWVACPQPKLNLSLQRGVIYGAILGALLGLAMALFMGRVEGFWQVVTLMFWESLGWALFGMIVGSSGLLARPRLASKLVHHLEEAIGEGKILLSLQVPTRAELNRAAQTLYKMGAADMHETDVLVA